VTLLVPWYAESLTDDITLRAIPLGGLGNVGGNMMAYETAEDLIAIDCGVLFPSTEQPGVDYVIPDVSYLLNNRNKLRGIVLTHGHEDHIGALPYVLPLLNTPIFATRLTLALVRNKLGEVGITPQMHEIHDGEPFSMGSFTIVPIPVTHSIPDAVALAIKTPVGTVVHTGDFKFDTAPLDNRFTDAEALRALGDAGVTALFSDSTNAERGGHTWPEREIGNNLRDIIGAATGRVLVTAFASNLHRLQLVIDASVQAGRKVMPIGRSIQQNIQLARETGYIRAKSGVFAEATDFGKLAPSEVTVIAAGSQGEPQSAMSRIARGEHGQVHVDPGDLVIFSSRRIPGNERAVGNLVNNLFRLGADVLDDRAARVHTSGHAFNDEQRMMLDLCRPTFFVPIHGEYRHLVKHAQLAGDAGIPRHSIAVVEDGHPVEIARHGDQIVMRSAPLVDTGHVHIDGKGVGDVNSDVLLERRILNESGMIVAVLILDEKGRVVLGPKLELRGLGSNTEVLCKEAITQITAELAKAETLNESEVTDRVRRALRRVIRRELGRRPLIVPVVATLKS